VRSGSVQRQNVQLLKGASCKRELCALFFPSRSSNFDCRTLVQGREKRRSYDSCLRILPTMTNHKFLCLLDFLPGCSQCPELQRARKFMIRTCEFSFEQSWFHLGQHGDHSFHLDRLQSSLDKRKGLIMRPLNRIIPQNVVTDCQCHDSERTGNIPPIGLLRGNLSRLSKFACT
jgi:hypothetical protein